MKQLFDNQRYNFAFDIIQQAGKIAKEFYGNSSSWKKSDNSIVTEADLAIDKFLSYQILNQYPADGFLCEESINQHPRFNCPWLWIIDPIDGTYGFNERNGEFVIMITLLYKNEIQFGLIYLPLEEELYYGGKQVPTTKFHNQIHQKIIPTTICKTTLVSRHNKENILEKFYKKEKLNKVSCGSSGYKLCKLLNGKASSYFHLSNVGEWDTAALDALIQGQNEFKISNRNGLTNTYNKKEPFSAGIFVYKDTSIQQRLLAFLQKNNI